MATVLNSLIKSMKLNDAPEDDYELDDDYYDEGDEYEEKPAKKKRKTKQKKLDKNVLKRAMEDDDEE